MLLSVASKGYAALAVMDGHTIDVLTMNDVNA